MKRIAFLFLTLLVIIAVAGCAKKRNQPPVIQGVQTEVTINQGDPYDPLSGVVAIDPEDGQVEVKIEGSYDVNVVGTHTFKVYAEDSQGLRTEVAVRLIVVGKDANNPPRFVYIKKIVRFYLGSNPENFDPIAGFEAEDADGDDVEITYTVEGNKEIDYTKPGRYTLIVTAKDSKGAVASETVTLEIIESEIPNELTTQPVTITFWHAFGQDKESFIRKYADEFQEMYRNVTIQLAGQGDYDGLLSKVTSSIVAGTTPTMLIGYPDHVANYLTANAIEPLDPYVNHIKWGLDLDDFIDSYIAENMGYDEAGTLYGLPFNKSTEVFIYNKTYFTQKDLPVPETWDKVVQAAQVIKQNETADDVYAFAYDSSANAFITLTRQWGGTYTSIGSDGKPILNFATDPKVMEMLNFFIDLHNNNYFTLPKEWEQDYASEMFIQKKVFMTVGSIAGITYNVPKDNSFEIGVAPIPYKTEETKAVIQQGTNVMIMKNATPYEKLYAWLFIKYLTSTDVTVDWAMKSGYLPVRESGYNSERYQNFLAFTEDYQKSDELRQLAIDRWNSKPANANKTITEQDIQNEIRDLKYISMAANAAYQQRNYMFVDPAFVGSSDVRKEVELMFDKIIVGKIPPQQAIAEALAELQGILR